MQNYKIVFCLILLWINFFQSFVFVVVGESENLNLNSDMFHYCNLTDTEKRAVMVISNNEMDPERAESQLPANQNDINDVFCKVSVNENCKRKLFLNSPWKHDYFKNFVDIPIIRKLEDYPSIKTNNTNLSKAVNQTFHNNISFSVLHRGGDPRAILIYLWDNSVIKTIIISQQENSSIFRISSEDDCPYEKTDNIDLTTWNNFTLTLQEENLTLTEESNNFTFSYPHNGFKPTHFAFGSSNAANWKLLSYGLFASNSNGNTTIPVATNGNNQEICIAILVGTCNNSNLTLELLGENDNVLDSQSPKNKNEWEELQLNAIANKTKLNVVLKADSCYSHIGDIRNCINETASMEVKTKLENVSMNVLPQTRNLKSKSLQNELNEKFPKCELQQNGTKLLINLKQNETPSFEFYYHLVINCSNEWCTQRSTQRSNITVNDTNVEADIEYGLSDYTVYLGIYEKENDTNVLYKNICSITTGPIAPRPIREIRVYEETNTSVSIRWPEPYPKNGILELITIEYKKKDKGDFGNIASVEWIERNITKPKACEIWERNFCVTLHNLTMNEKYSIKIKAKNKDVEEFSNVGTSVDALTTENAPASPIDLTTIWDDFLNLTINCSYPSDVKGPIRKLHIFINNTETIFDIPSTTRNYSFNIDALNYSSTRQEIMVLFSNFAGKSKSIKEIVIIPPRTPILRDGLIKETDENVFVDLSLIENVHNKSEIYVYYIDKKSNITLNKNCNDFDILENKPTKKIIIYPNNNKTTTLTKNNETSQCIIVIFVKNSFGNYSRCSTYSDKPIFSKKDTRKSPTHNSASSDNIIVIIVVLLLVLITLSATIYMYKTKRITYKPDWVDTFLPQTRTTTVPNIAYKNDAVLIPLSNNPKFSQVVQVKDFMNYVNNAIQQGVLFQEYTTIDELNDKFDTAAGLDPNNSKKNRYKNIIAYDKTRVKLSNITYSNTSDYINANYIDGFNKEKAFIAAQAPTGFTVADFWMMIWQENVQCIVMLSKLIESGKPKCEKYWPNELETFKFGEIAIKCIDSKGFGDNVTIRTFEIYSESTMRKLVQIHYEGWLDKDVPVSTSGIENVLHKMKNYENECPIVVHCSAGVGRTGTLILANIAINMAKATGIIDMPSILYDLRQQRTKMVQTFDQYVFAHQVVSNIKAPIYANE
nr:phosphatidylinositol phosphatase PTPRQ-like [Onthophagus taurus]